MLSKKVGPGSREKKKKKRKRETEPAQLFALQSALEIHKH